MLQKPSIALANPCGIIYQSPPTSTTTSCCCTGALGVVILVILVQSPVYVCLCDLVAISCFFLCLVDFFMYDTVLNE